MAGQDDACWKCGATWDDRLGPRNAVRTIPGSAADRPDSGDHQLTPAAASAEAGAVAHGDHEADRWADEGGRVAAEVPA